MGLGPGALGVHLALRVSMVVRSRNAMTLERRANQEADERAARSLALGTDIR